MLQDWIWLTTRKALGPRGVLRVLEYFGTPERAFYADSEQYDQIPELPAAARASLREKRMDEADRILGECDRLGLRVMTLQDGDYPGRLREIAAPPAVLYIRGRVFRFDEEAAIGVVGSRDPSPYGERVAAQLGLELARGGALLVSGIAQGIDSTALKGALKGGGPVVSVLAGGVDVPYPSQNRFLYEDVAAAGALISEYPPGAATEGWHYPIRNRIISGLSVASVIVEASDWRSGALITARHALDQGRDVYAVPGPIDAPQSQSCNELIEKGEAALLSSPVTLVRAYGGMMPEQAVQQAFRRQTGEYPEPAARSAWEDIRRREQQAEQRRAAAAEKAKAEPKTPSAAAKPLPDGLNEDEKTIVTLVRDGVSTPEELIDRCGLAAPRVMSLVTMLEMDGILRREKGRLILGTW